MEAVVREKGIVKLMCHMLRYNVLAVYESCIIRAEYFLNDAKKNCK